ncbi:MAG: glycoside hydrolase family 3 N-terminal domain-containing protein [Polyangiaceae bacterium]
MPTAAGALTPGVGGPSGVSGQPGVPGGAGQPGTPGAGGAGGGDVPPPSMLGGDDTVPPPVVAVCQAATYSDKFTPGQNVPPPPSDAEVQSVLNLMALPERIKQLQGVDVNLNDQGRYNDVQRSQDAVLLDNTPIRGYFYRDAARGVNLDARQEQREFVNNYATVFPVASARGASFDLDLEYRIGEAIADETVASQNTMLLAPCMNILRHPYWGRSQETYGEDVFHLGRMASALTAGLQTNVVACAKHFAANNVENGRDNNNADMDEQTLREIYARHFEMVIEEGGVGCIMAAYNSVNGTKSTQNAHLLTDILRTDFGYQGLVLTDWWAMPGAQSAPSTQTAQSNATQALRAGLDVEVPWTLNYGQLDELVTGGQLQQSEINTAAARVIKQKMRFNALYRNTTPPATQPIGLKPPTTTMVQGSIANNDAHIALSREAAVKSMVLLKNDNATLPLAKTSGTTVAVLGLSHQYLLQSTTNQPGTQQDGFINFAVDVNLGDRGSSRVNADPAKSVGPLAGFQQVGAASGVNVITGNTAAAAANANFVVVVVGLTPGDEGEEYAIPAGGDRATLSLPGNQNQLIADVAALGKPMVVVIEAGGIVEMPWLAQVPAVVHAWYPGQQGGLALAQLVFGDANFTGKLPVSWFRDQDLPEFKGVNGATTQMAYYLGYRLIDQENLTPVYPFGHGLSYSTYTYANLQLGCPTAEKEGVIPVSVDVTNSSAVPGEEVVFVFARFPSTTARRSEKELKGFTKVALAANETKSVTIPIRVKDLKYWQGDASGQWVVESGPVELIVGKSAADADVTTLRGTVNVL